MKLVKVTKINQVTPPDTFSGDYSDLENKPTIPTALSALTTDTNNQRVSETEKTTWNGKADASHIHTGTLIFTYNL